MVIQINILRSNQPNSSPRSSFTHGIDDRELPIDRHSRTRRRHLGHHRRILSGRDRHSRSHRVSHHEVETTSAILLISEKTNFITFAKYKDLLCLNKKNFKKCIEIKNIWNEVLSIKYTIQKYVEKIIITQKNASWVQSIDVSFSLVQLIWKLSRFYQHSTLT